MRKKHRAFRNFWPNCLCFSIIVSLIFIGCNNDLAVKPKENTQTDSTLIFNFKAIPNQDFYRANTQGIYEVDIELYLRMFEELNPQTPLKLEFKTENFGVFVINKDTLYPDDQTILKLSDLKKFRNNGQFYCTSSVRHTLNFEIEIGKTKKATKASFETK